ncbi:TPA_asm: L [Vicia betacytorhabdovirus 1]|nr:TPA_asm: L [Vicia betacytorhabdovirus 1]
MTESWSDYIRYPKGLGDYHLRSALIKVPLESYKAGKGRRRELKCYNRINKTFNILECLDPGFIMSSVMEYVDYEIPVEMRHKSDIVSLLEMEFKGMEDFSHQDDPPSRAVNALKENSITSKYGRIKELFQLGLIYLCAITSEREFHPKGKFLKEINGEKAISVGPIIFYLFGDLIGFSPRLGKSKGLDVHLMSLDAYRMITDKLTERDNVLLSSELGSLIFPEIYPKSEFISEIFSFLDSFLRTTGNDGYRLLKTYEALITGIILSSQKSFFLETNEFLLNTVNNLPSEYQDTSIEFINLIRKSCQTIHHMTQIMGLFRLWGHPEVNAKQGMKKVRTIGTADKLIYHNIVKSSGRKFKEILCLNYYSTKGTYPSMIFFEEGVDSYILTQIMENSPINLRDPGYTSIDWDLITFSETFISPKTFNLSMIVSDTAISPTRSESYEAKENNSSITNPMIRRGVLKWMRDGMVDCSQLLSEIDENDLGLELDDRIIGLYPKEREMNPVPRMFALMSLKMRSYIVITENILSDHILPLIPGITMTHSMLDLQKEMVKNTKSQSNKRRDSVTFCINMDFEKWNLNMRKESTFEVFESLGQLFGFPSLYNKTYDIFENSIIYLADGSYVLNLDENGTLLESDNDLAYCGHKGGFEGLRQKGWTIFTVVLIALVCDSLGVKYRLMGQGDNQVLIVTLYSHKSRIFGLESEEARDEIMDTLTELQKNLQETFDSVGLPLKPLESWTSEDFFAYGKFPIYRGVPCSMSLKKISRIFFFSNEDLMTIDNAMGSIASNAQSAVMADVHPIISYVVAKWQQYCCVRVFMHYHPLLGKAIRDEKKSVNFSFKTYDGVRTNYSADKRIPENILIKLILTVPKSLGGYNSINFFDMIMRGFTDPPSKDMCYLFALTSSSLGEFQKYITNWRNVLVNDQIDYVHLAQDPTSLNIFCPPNSSTIIKRMITDTVKSLPVESEFSQWFYEVLEVSDSDEVRELCEKLTESPELNARFIHDFLGATLYGYSDSITSKVDKTVTLSRITLGSSQNNVVGALCSGETRFWEYFEWRSQQTNGLWPSIACPNHYVRIIREIGWRKKVLAVSTPFPFHYISTNSGDTDLPDSYIEGYVSDTVLLSPNKLVLNCGNSLPYLGSVTKEKIFSPAPRITFGTEPLISRPLRLMRAIGWFINEFSNWALSLKSLLRSVTDLDPNDVIYIPDHVKGSMAHRYSDMATKHGSLWMPLFGPPTHFHISTNSFHEFSKGSQNVTLHFQATLCFIQYLLLNQTMSLSREKMVKYYKCCSHCIIPVDEEFPDLPDQINSNLIPSRKENPYLFIRSEDIFFIHRRELYLKAKLSNINFRALLLNEALTRNVLEEILACQLATKVMYGNSESGIIFDLQTTSRVMYLKMRIEAVFRKAIMICFLIMCESEKKTEVFPSWDYMKGKLLRRLQFSNSDNYLILGGFFCWAEYLNFIKERQWASLPQTYPITATGVASACKQSFINFAKRSSEVRFSGTGVLPCYVINNVSWLAKLPLLRRNELQVERCYDCCAQSMKTPLKFENQSFDIIQIRCREKHTVFSEQDFNNCLIYEGNTDSLCDIIPNVNLTVKRRKDIPILYQSWFSGSILLSSLEVKFYEKKRSRPMANFPITVSGFTQNEFRQKWKHPTSSAYRIYDLLNMSPELQGPGGIIVLGDGYGMSSLIVKMFYQKRNVSSWTLIDITEAMPHSLSMSRPPTHYFLDLDIESELSIKNISDIRNPRFQQEFTTYCQEKGVSTCISDIEIWYSGGNVDDPALLVKLFWMSGINQAAVKVSMSNVLEIEPYLIQACVYYDNWKIICNETCKLTKGTVWVILRGRRTSISDLKYLTSDSLDLIEKRISTLMVNGCEDLQSCSRNRWSVVESVLMDTRLGIMMYNYLDNWFGSANMLGWDGNNFTQLFYNIRTGKKAYIIQDAHGNRVHYLYNSDEISLFVRIMSLALSQVSEDFNISNFFNCEEGWSIRWKSDDNHLKSRLVKNWNPELIRCSNSKFWTLENKKLIFDHASMVRLFRRNQDSSYEPTEVKDTITFRYIPDHKLSLMKELYFPISKIAEYGLSTKELSSSSSESEHDFGLIRDSSLI